MGLSTEVIIVIISLLIKLGHSAQFSSPFKIMPLMNIFKRLVH